MRALIAFAAALFWASPGLAAPFDCTRDVIGSGDVSLGYSASRTDRIVDFRANFAGPFSRDCFFDATGRIDAVSGEGSARFDNGEDYVVAVRGDLGTSLFDEDFSGFPDLDALSDLPPDHRLDFRPLGGRNLDFAYPNGFSIALDLDCPFETENCDFGPFFLYDIEDGRVSSILSDGGGPYVLGTVPLPAGFPLALAALGALGWVSRKRRR